MGKYEKRYNKNRVNKVKKISGGIENEKTKRK